MTRLIGELRSLIDAVRADSLDTPWARVRTLRISREDHERLVAEFPPREGPPAVHSIALVVDRYLPAGHMIPLDADGKPIELRPRSTHPLHKKEKHGS